MTEEADLDNVNLAYTVKDGQKIYIPSIHDEEDIKIVSNDVQENDINNTENMMININTATQTELGQLPGIGPLNGK